MNILAVDYGVKRIGLAWRQTGVDLVLPFGVITTSDKASVLEQLIELIKKEDIDKLIIGLPLGLDGQENDNSSRVRGFMKELCEMTEVPVEFIDERFTSAEADNLGGDASRDEKAAMAILTAYLEKK